MIEGGEKTRERLGEGRDMVVGEGSSLGVYSAGCWERCTRFHASGYARSAVSAMAGVQHNLALALDSIRSSSAGLIPEEGGERVASIGGRWPPCPESHTHRPRQRARVRREHHGQLRAQRVRRPDSAAIVLLSNACVFVGCNTCALSC